MKRKENFSNLIGKEFEQQCINKKEWSLASSSFGKVILINGNSSSGKTTLSSTLVKYGFNKIDYDDICEGIVISYFIKIIPELSEIQKYLKHDDIKKIIIGFKINDDLFDKSQKELLNQCTDKLAIYKDNHNINSQTIKWFLHIREILNDGYYFMAQECKKFIYSGQNVVINAVMLDSKIDFFLKCLDNYPIYKLLLYCPLAENLVRCFKRNDLSLEKNLCDYRHPDWLIDKYFDFYECTTLEGNSSNIILGKVDKTKTKEILETITLNVEKHKEQLLFLAGDISYEEYIQKLKVLKQKVYDVMMLSSDQTIYETTGVPFGMCIDSFTMIDFDQLTINLLEQENCLKN